MDRKPIGAIHAEIGRRIKERRTELGPNQTAVGKAARVSQQQITNYESGTARVKFERLVRIARRLRLSPDIFSTASHR